MLVNGIDVHLEEPISLQTFLEQQGYNIKRIAVERNLEIVSKAAYIETILQPSDSLEIVNFMGGG